MVKRRFVFYLPVAFIFAVVFGEVIGPLLAGHSLPLLEFPIPILVYYLLLTTIFSFVAAYLNFWLAAFVFFLYGALAELWLFHNVKGLTDIPGLLFFGFFYVFLFGVPRWLVFRYIK